MLKTGQPIKSLLNIQARFYSSANVCSLVFVMVLKRSCGFRYARKWSVGFIDNL